MVVCGLGMQQYAMHIVTIQKTTFFELGVCISRVICAICKAKVLPLSSTSAACVLRTFINFGHFPASRSYKKILIKRKKCPSF